MAAAVWQGSKSRFSRATGVSASLLLATSIVLLLLCSSVSAWSSGSFRNNKSFIRLQESPKTSIAHTERLCAHDQVVSVHLDASSQHRPLIPQLSSSTTALSMAKSSSNDQENTTKPSLGRRIWRVSTYPVRKVGRILFRRKKTPKETTDASSTSSTLPLESVISQVTKETKEEFNEEDEEEESDEDIQEEIQEIVNDAKTTLDETVSSISEKVDDTVNSLTEKVDDTVNSLTENLASALSTAEESVKELASPLTKSPTSAKNVDLSGDWNLIVTDDFKQEYERYLTLLGQPFFVRSVALSIVALTTESTKQTNNGKELLIKGQNLRGVWERTLVTESDNDADKNTITTADGEQVACEAWWEKGGTVHRSWLRGVQKYGGGSFESKRFLENEGSVLVCESIFHPTDESREKATVTWRFQRQSSAAGAGKEESAVKA